MPIDLGHSKTRNKLMEMASAATRVVWIFSIPWRMDLFLFTLKVLILINDAKPTCWINHT
jgi:hypothetical protein